MSFCMQRQQSQILIQQPVLCRAADEGVSKSKTGHLRATAGSGGFYVSIDGATGNAAGSAATGAEEDEDDW